MSRISEYNRADIRRGSPGLIDDIQALEDAPPRVWSLPLDRATTLAIYIAANLYFNGVTASPKSLDLLCQPHPIGLRRPPAAGYYFTILRRVQGHPAVRKSTPGVTEEAAEICSQLNSSIESIESAEDVKSTISSFGSPITFWLATPFRENLSTNVEWGPFSMSPTRRIYTYHNLVIRWRMPFRGLKRLSWTYWTPSRTQTVFTMKRSIILSWVLTSRRTTNAFASGIATNIFSTRPRFLMFMHLGPFRRCNCICCIALQHTLLKVINSWGRSDMLQAARIKSSWSGVSGQQYAFLVPVFFVGRRKICLLWKPSDR